MHSSYSGPSTACASSGNRGRAGGSSEYQRVLRQRQWRNAAGLTLQFALLGALALAFFLRTPQVSGFSMEPRIDSGEYVLINTVAFRIGPIKRGDIVAFRHVRSAPSVYLKRIVGLPGEQITILRGKVQVNGTALAEPYVRFSDGRSYPTVTVPPRSYYVLGDNRANSDDSRDWGFVEAEDVVGKAVLAVWPPSRVGAL